MSLLLSELLYEIISERFVSSATNPAVCSTFNFLFTTMVKSLFQFVGKLSYVSPAHFKVTVFNTDSLPCAECDSPHCFFFVSKVCFCHCFGLTCIGYVTWLIWSDIDVVNMQMMVESNAEQWLPAVFKVGTWGSWLVPLALDHSSLSCFHKQLERWQ